MGSISEVFDAESPFTPRGCVAQAWSVGEVLRTLVKTAGIAPPRRHGASWVDSLILAGKRPLSVTSPQSG